MDPIPAAPPPSDGSRDEPNDGYPDFTPPELTPKAEQGETGARNVLLTFARALEMKEFDHAWALLGAADRQRWDRAAFARLFDDLDDIAVAVPNGRLESSAGSSTYIAPLIMTAIDSNGRPVRIEGEALLRRVKDVAGTVPAPPRWRFERVTIDWTH